MSISIPLAFPRPRCRIRTTIRSADVGLDRPAHHFHVFLRLAPTSFLEVEVRGSVALGGKALDVAAYVPNPERDRDQGDNAPRDHEPPREDEAEQRDGQADRSEEG